MGKAKLRPLAAIMKIIESVPGDAREELEADLRDLLRPAPKPRQKGRGGSKTAQKRKAGKEATTASDGGKNCWNCGLLVGANIHQLPTHPNYHEFVASIEPAGEAKGASV